MKFKKYLLSEAKTFTPENFDAKEIKALKSKFKKGKNKITSAVYSSDYITIMRMTDNNPDETFGWEITRDKKNYVATHYYTQYQADDTNPDSSEDFKVPVSKGIDALVKKLEKEFR